MSQRRVDGFVGPYRFLSNFYPSSVAIVVDDAQPDTVGLLTCPTVEHAFQASKTLDVGRRMWVARSATPAVARRRGRLVDLRPDWENVKVGIMLGLLWQKFAPRSPLGHKLRELGAVELIEENHHGDRYWGRVRGDGQNMLGQLLMRVRDELLSEVGNVQ